MITFQSFLQSVRKQKRVDLETLGMGICSSSFLSRLENGDRKAPYLLRECLMGRLGVSGENFYEYLQPKEYKAWKLRQEIVHNFLFDEFKALEKNIDKYGMFFSSDDVISKQFYLYVRAEAMANRGKKPAETLRFYKEAADCSMSHLLEDFDAHIDSALLSIQEYSVLVKYLFAEIEATKADDTEWVRRLLLKLAAVMDKIENDTSDEDIVSKIYSMAVAFFSKGIREYFAKDSALLFEEKERCFKAVAFLRKARKTYFLTEIVDALSTNGCLNESEERYLPELTEYVKAIESVYRDHDLSMKKCNSGSAYILVESGAYAIGDILQRRRKMLRLYQKDLCENICTDKTMARMENGKCAVQDVIFKNLCERLKLVPDYVHGEIVYDDLGTYEIYKKVKEADNGKNIEELRNNLNKLKDRMNLEVLSNRQCWERALYNLKRENDEISDEEYCDNIRRLLNLTVGDIDEIDSKCVCFTDSEKMLLQNLALRYSGPKKHYLDLIVSELTDDGGDIKLLMHYRINAFLFCFYASELGNEKLYEESDAISDRVLHTGLRISSLGYIGDCIYNKYWNAKQFGPENKKALAQCIALSRYAYDKRDEDFYASKLME